MSDSTNLKFNNTKGIRTFLTSQGLTSMEIVKNPHKDTRFFVTSDSSISGKVSGKLTELTEDTQVSECVDKSTGESFMMAHPKGQGQNIISSFKL